MFFLDTDITTLVFHKHERVMTQISKVNSDEIALSLVTRIEMLRGRIEAVLKAATAEELLRAVAGLTRTETFLAQFPIASVDEDAAAVFEQFRVNKKLRKIDRGDLLQAAVAVANSATLVTRNMRDYESVPNLKLENWAD